MKVILILACILAIALASAEFQQFSIKFNKKYDTKEEYQKRLDIYTQNKQFIEEFNKGKESYTLAINEFADLTHEEFKKGYLAPKFDATKVKRKNVKAFPTGLKLPTTVDWRQHNAVTHIKNQGQCGSCWSFSTTGSVEGARAIATGALISLSEQQLVDCSDAYGNQGCNGGLMDDAFQYIIAKGGLETETRYPYTAQDGTCQSNTEYFRTDISGYQDITSGSEPDLQTAVANIGPISVAIDAGQNSFQFYSGGVYYSKGCSPTNLDHGVLAIGYGVYQGTDYWLVKNSWGTSWGLQGYIMMSRNKDNNCGIATMSSYPTGAHAASLFKKWEKFNHNHKLSSFKPTK